MARHAYLAHRLTSRRSVRLALALGQGLRHGPRAARELLTAGAGELDLPGPPIDDRSWYPWLRVAHLGASPITEGLIPGTRLFPDRWRTQLRRDRPDLVLLDDRWADAGEFRALLREHEGRLVVVGPRADQLELEDAVPFGVHSTVVDDRRFSPVELPVGPNGSTRRLSDQDTAQSVLSDDRSRAQVLVSAATDRHVERDLQLQATGAVVVPEDPSPTWVERCDAAGTVGHAPEVYHDPRAWEQASVAARRHALLRFGRHAALERLLQTLNVPITPPRISVLLCTRRPDHLASALAQIAAQHYPDLEIIVGLHGFERPRDEIMGHAGTRRVRTIEVDRSRPLGAVLNAALKESTGDLIAKMDDDDLYGPDHLGDLLLALRYSGATLVGRRDTTAYLESQDRTVTPALAHQERWTTHLPGATMLVHADVLRRLRWRNVPNAVDTELVRSITSDGGTVYSTHRFGFIRRRHDDHTYARSDRSFRGARVVEGLDRAVLDIPGGAAG